MRVAVVATSTARGGAEQYLYRLYQRLASDYGVEPTLIGSLPDWPEDLGPVVRIRHSRKLTMRSSLLKQGASSCIALAQIFREVRRGNFDAVHIQFFEPKFVLPTLLRRTRVLWTEHGPLPGNLPSIALRLIRAQSKFAHVVAVSEAVRESLSAVGIKSSVIWNPLPPPATEAMADVHDDVGTDVRRRRRVLYAGRLHSAKRVHLLIEAARYLPDTDFTVAGDGPSRSELERGAPDNVEFLGSLPSVEHLFEKCDAIVVCSGREAREGSPMIVLEGRQASTRILMANDCHAAGEAVTLGGQLFRPSGKSLAAAIAALPVASPFPLSTDILFRRSEAEWARQHFERLTGAGKVGRE